MAVTTEETEDEVPEDEVAKRLPGGVQDTLPCPPSHAATAIILMENLLGTVWLPTAVPGRTSVHQNNEVPANLTKGLVMTSCFQR